MIQKQKHPAIALCVLCGLLILVVPAFACGFNISSYNRFQFAAQLFNLSSVASTSFYGLPLVAIIGIESFILHKQLEINSRKALLLVTEANLFYIISNSMSSLLWFSFPIPGIGGILSAKMCSFFCERSGYFKHLSKVWFEVFLYLTFISLDIGSFFLTSALDINSKAWIVYAAISGLLGVGFLTGFVAKGFILGLNLRNRSNLATTVMSMSVASFPVLALVAFIQKYAFSNSIFNP